MNRRNLLKTCGQAAIGLVAAPFVLGDASPSISRVVAGNAFRAAEWTQVAKAEHVAVIHRMIRESGSWWLQVRDRENGKNPALVYFGNGPIFEVSRTPQQTWNVYHRPITRIELAEFNGYIKSIAPHCGTTVGVPAYDGSQYTIRAWIKNGRQQEWNMSIEKL